MPDLIHSLLNRDPGHLQIVAALWDVELKSSDADLAVKELATSVLDSKSVAELIDSLPASARAALTGLTDSGGRILWAKFTRDYGDIREMGAAKRDREKPHLNPFSTAEILYYRALIARAFFDTDKGPQEFAYIPDDLFSLLPVGARHVSPLQNREPLGRAATSAEQAHVIPANDRVLDDSTTILAALRLGRSDYQSHLQSNPKLISLLQAAGLLKKNIPQAEAVREFLEASRKNALTVLIQAWRNSETFNELRLMPNLICEGAWKNQPLATRQFLLSLLDALPRGKWWNLDSFVNDIKKKTPDFQRPAGDYDSWFIKRASDGHYLRGFEAWSEVDGALIRFFITDVLHWLGMVDLASAKPDGEITAFRLTAPDSRKSNIENAKVKISSQGRVIVPRLVARSVRYQIARFCEWEAGKADDYQYRITPQSLARAQKQGLKVEHLLALLAKHADAGIPPILVKALKRWDVNGTEARAETQVVLHLGKPEVLKELRKSKASRFLGEPLGPTSIVIKAGAQSKVMAALAEIGLLAEDTTENKES